MRLILALFALSACSRSAPPVEPPTEPAPPVVEAPPPAPSHAQTVVDAPDRSDDYRALDAGRQPVKLLEWADVQPGMRVAELMSGGGYTVELLARAVGEAENHLKAMKDAVLRAGDRTVETRVDRFQDTARDLFRTVEEDPRDLTGARKWLGVYLLGARDATVKFADLYSRSRDAQARADYIALLDDLEQGFADRTAKMLLDDRSDLDVEIEVLRERLEREGVHRK